MACTAAAGRKTAATSCHCPTAIEYAVAVAGAARSCAQMLQWRMCIEWDLKSGREVRMGNRCRNAHRACAAGGCLPTRPLFHLLPVPPTRAAYSKVRLATHRETGQHFACKIVPLPNPNQASNEHMSSRASIMRVGGRDLSGHCTLHIAAHAHCSCTPPPGCLVVLFRSFPQPCALFCNFC